MHSDELLTAAVLLLGVSAAALVASRRAGFGSILGLIAAGILLGPHTPGPVVDIGPLGPAAELGVVFLLFVIGL
jgi:Kef-type K+ transport system membrane component KefB